MTEQIQEIEGLSQECPIDRVGREQLARKVLVEGLSPRLATASFGVSEKTAAKWARRY